LAAVLSGGLVVSCLMARSMMAAHVILRADKPKRQLCQEAASSVLWVHDKVHSTRWGEFLSRVHVEERNSTCLSKMVSHGRVTSSRWNTVECQIKFQIEKQIKGRILCPDGPQNQWKVAPIFREPISRVHNQVIK